MKYRISMQNSAGVLDVRIVDTQKEIRAAVVELAAEVDDWYPGDKIVVEEWDR